MENQEIIDALQFILKQLTITGQLGVTQTIIFAALISAFIGAFKMTSLRKFWDKLGRKKILIAPILSLVPIIMSAFKQGSFDYLSFLSSMTIGPGAIAIHKIYSASKKVKERVGEKMKAGKKNI